MTTAEFIVCELMGCGQLDIEACFGKMDDNILANAISCCKDEFGTTDMGAIWQTAIEDAANDVFGDYELVEPYFNYLDCSVGFVGDPTTIENFEEKCDEFYQLTGQEISY